MHHDQNDAIALPMSAEDKILTCATFDKPASPVGEQVVSLALSKPTNLKVCDKVRPSFDAESPLTPGMHPAELFADQLLASPQAPTKADLCHLHSLLPQTHSSRFQGGSTVTAGVFRHGGIVGLRKTTCCFL